MHERTLLSIGSWVAIGLISWVVAWVIAESIPVFNNLLSLIVRGHLLLQNMHANIVDRLHFLAVGSLVSFKNPKMLRIILTTSHRWIPCYLLVHPEQGPVVRIN